MKFLIKQNILVDKLQKVLGPTVSKQNNPILNSILIEAHKNNLKVTATDLDTTIIAFSEANIIKEGKISVSSKRFVSIVRELPPKEITVELIKNNLLIKCEKIEFKINTQNPEEFPKITPIERVSLIKINSQNLSQIIKLTSFCVGQEDTNYVLNGILFEVFENQLNAISTDGKRLSFVKTHLAPNQSEVKTKIKFILPIRAVNEVQKLIKEKDDDMFFFVEKNRVGFDLKDTQLIIKPIEGEFPDYNQYIPKPHPNKMTITRRDFLNSLKRGALLSTADYQGIKLEVKKNEIIISKATPQMGEVKETLSCQYSGKPLQMGFNPQYFIDILRNLEEDSVDLEFLDIDKPVVMRKNDYVYLVLPMRI